MSRSRLAAALAGLFCLGPAAARAQEAGPADGRVTAGILRSMLSDAGYRPRDAGPGVSQVTVERDDWEVHVCASVSRDGQTVWLDVKFGRVSRRAAGEAYLALLEANDRIGPAHFAVDAEGRLHLLRSLPNQGLTPERLRRHVEELDAAARRTEPLWRPANFSEVPTPEPAPAAPPAPPPAAFLEGTWRIVAVRSPNGTPDPTRVRAVQMTLEFRGGGLTVSRAGGAVESIGYAVRGAGPVWEIDITNADGRVEKGIFRRLPDGRLEIHYADPGSPRPASFEVAGGTAGGGLIRLEQIPAEE